MKRANPTMIQAHPVTWFGRTVSEMLRKTMTFSRSIPLLPPWARQCLPIHLSHPMRSSQVKDTSILCETHLHYARGRACLRFQLGGSLQPPVKFGKLARQQVCGGDMQVLWACGGRSWKQGHPMDTSQ